MSLVIMTSLVRVMMLILALSSSGVGQSLLSVMASDMPCDSVT